MNDISKKQIETYGITLYGMMRSRSRNNRSGVTGVDYIKKSNRWRARIGYMRTKIWLGEYRTREEAVRARQQAEAELYGPVLQDARWRGLIDEKGKGTGFNARQKKRRKNEN